MQRAMRRRTRGDAARRCAALASALPTGAPCGAQCPLKQSSHSYSALTFKTAGRAMAQARRPVKDGNSSSIASRGPVYGVVGARSDGEPQRTCGMCLALDGRAGSQLPPCSDHTPLSRRPRPHFRSSRGQTCSSLPRLRSHGRRRLLPCPSQPATAARSPAPVPPSIAAARAMEAVDEVPVAPPAEEAAPGPSAAPPREREDLSGEPIDESALIRVRRAAAGAQGPAIGQCGAAGARGKRACSGRAAAAQHRKAACASPAQRRRPGRPHSAVDSGWAAQAAPLAATGALRLAPRPNFRRRAQPRLGWAASTAHARAQHSTCSHTAPALQHLLLWRARCRRTAATSSPRDAGTPLTGSRCLAYRRSRAR